MKMKEVRKAVSLLLAAALLLTMVDGRGGVQAAKKSKKAKARVSSVKIMNAGKKLRLQKGKKFSLKTSVKVKPNKSKFKKLKFTSSNRKVVLVSSRGVLKGLRVGTARVTAESKSNPKKKASLSVSVTKDVLVTDIRLNKTKITVDEFSEDEIQLSVRKILPANAKNKEVEWSSSNDDIAEVDEDGVVTPGGVGTATITATAADRGGAYATCRVTVKENGDGGDETEATQQPARVTQEPTGKPAEETQEPTKKPVEETQEPTKKPVEETQEPTKKPAEETQEPTKKPAGETQEPTRKPAAPTETPTVPTETHNSPTKNPAEVTETPAYVTQSPTKTSAAPTETSAAPTETSVAPTTTPAAPTVTPARIKKVSLTNDNVFFKTGLEDKEGNRDQDIAATEHADGSITYDTSALQSGGGMSFYANDDQSPLDMSKYSRIIVTVSSPQENTDMSISLQSDRIGESSQPQVFAGSIKYGCMNEANKRYQFVIDLTQASYDPGNDGLDAYGVYVKYNGYKKPSEDATDEEKRALRKTITIHSIELVRKIRNEAEVAALKRMITEQKALGATVGEDVDDYHEYGWNDEGHLEEIRWGEKDLSGDLSFAAFKELTGLECGGNQLSSLDVSQNPELTRLWCRNNQLSSLDVSRNPKLTVLECDYNQLSSLDVSRNAELTRLWCRNNQLSSLDVSRNVQLTELWCDDNQLSSLDVSRNVELKELLCNHNQLSSLDVSRNVELTRLWCQDNQLSSLDLSNNRKLSSFNYDKNVKLIGWGEVPEFDPTKKVENVTLEYGDEGYLFKKADRVLFSDAVKGYPEDGIDVRYYNKVIVKYTCDVELGKEVAGWAGKSVLNTTDVAVPNDVYGDGICVRYFDDADYKDGSYTVEYNIKETEKFGGVLSEFDFDKAGLINCITVMLSGENPYVDSEDGSEKGVNLRLRSIEFVAEEEANPDEVLHFKI